MNNDPAPAIFPHQPIQITHEEYMEAIRTARAERNELLAIVRAFCACVVDGDGVWTEDEREGVRHLRATLAKLEATHG